MARAAHVEMIWQQNWLFRLIAWFLQQRVPHGTGFGRFRDPSRIDLQLYRDGKTRSDYKARNDD